MTWTIDARVPVHLGEPAEAGPDDAVLRETVAREGNALGRFAPASPDHTPGCACCAPRNGAALALNALFQARAKGEVPFFRRVVAVTLSEAGDLEVWAALHGDPLTASRFRPA